MYFNGLLALKEAPYGGAKEWRFLKRAGYIKK